MEPLQNGVLPMVSFDNIEQARDRIKEYIKTTPLRAAPKLSDFTGASVFLKLESEQVTGYG